MISVITPVHNDGLYLKKAITSVLIQPEVSEYIIIDDGSTDNSWEIIKEFEKKEERIIGLRHPDNKNHGRPKSRNLGIRHAKNNWIAFLDADDFYLENRFTNDVKLIEVDKTIDGIYNAIGVHFYETYKGSKNISRVLTTLSERIEPEHLFENMTPFGKKGWFHCDGFLVKKSCLEKVGGFNEKLPVAQDTELFSKLAMTYRLAPGNLIEAVAKRGIHDTNVFYQEEKYLIPYLDMHLSLMQYAQVEQVSIKRKRLTIDQFLEYLSIFPGHNKFIIYFKYWFKGLFCSFHTLTNSKFYRNFFNALHYFWTNKIRKRILS